MNEDFDHDVQHDIQVLKQASLVGYGGGETVHSICV
jgi:hypothetical protein